VGATKVDARISQWTHRSIFRMILIYQDYCNHTTTKGNVVHWVSLKRARRYFRAMRARISSQRAALADGIGEAKCRSRASRVASIGYLVNTVLIASLIGVSACKQAVSPAPPPVPEVVVTNVIQQDVPVFSDWVGTTKVSSTRKSIRRYPDTC